MRRRNPRSRGGARNDQCGPRRSDCRRDQPWLTDGAEIGCGMRYSESYLDLVSQPSHPGSGTVLGGVGGLRVPGRGGREHGFLALFRPPVRGRGPDSAVPGRVTPGGAGCEPRPSRPDRGTVAARSHVGVAVYSLRYSLRSSGIPPPIRFSEPSAPTSPPRRRGTLLPGLGLSAQLRPSAVSPESMWVSLPMTLSDAATCGFILCLTVWPPRSVSIPWRFLQSTSRCGGGPTQC